MDRKLLEGRHVKYTVTCIMFGQWTTQTEVFNYNFNFLNIKGIRISCQNSWKCLAKPQAHIWMALCPHELMTNFKSSQTKQHSFYFSVHLRYYSPQWGNKESNVGIKKSYKKLRFSYNYCFYWFFWHVTVFRYRGPKIEI